MAVAAELVADDQIVARRVERRRELADVAGHEHRVDVRAGDTEAVCHVGARQAEAHAAAGWYMDLVRHEREHRPDNADFDRAVGELDRFTDAREAGPGSTFRTPDAAP